MIQSFIGTILSLLLLTVLPIAIIVTVAKRFSGRSRGGAAQPVRGFFQYAVTYGLLIVVAVGVSGLLGLALHGGTTLVADPGSLAMYLSFTVVGAPLLTVMVMWARKRIARDPGEAHAPALGLFVMVATLTALGNALVNLSTILGWAIRASVYDLDIAQAIAKLTVWGAVWLVSWRLHGQLSTPTAARTHHIIGSAATGIATIVGMVAVVGQLLRLAMGYSGVALVSSTQDSVADSLPVLAVGLLGWSIYWLRTASRDERSVLWHAYVLLGGVGAGFVMVVVAASTVLYRLLVWFVGDPATTDMRLHFDGAPMSLAVIAAGSLWWLHHRSLLGTRQERTEVVRIYDYILSGISLVSSAVGLSIVVVAGIESAVPGTVIAGSNSLNTLLAALTLLAVGGPLWWSFWHRIQRTARGEGSTELASPTRRVYLYALFGVGGIAAIVSLLVAVYMLFNDLIAGDLTSLTVRDMRYALGVLASTALLAAYHWTVFRHERDVDVEFASRTKSVMLIGADDHAAVRAIAERTGARVSHWRRTDSRVGWDVERVVALINEVAGDELVIVADPSGPFAIPVERRS